jgi:hypothetical protein
MIQLTHLRPEFGCSRGSLATLSGTFFSNPYSQYNIGETAYRLFWLGDPGVRDEHTPDFSNFDSSRRDEPANDRAPRCSIVVGSKFILNFKIFTLSTTGASGQRCATRVIL